MEDIAPELLSSLRKSFAERIEQSSIIDSLYKRIENGSATYAEAEDFAYEVGKCLAETFKSGLSSAVLPDGKMYYNIADRVIRPLLSDDHTIVSDAAAMVQKSLNKGAGIGLQAKKPKINEDRVAGIIDKVSDADQYDDVAWVLDAPVVNFSQSVVDDMLKGNVELHGKAGLTPKIIRKAERKCCKWCKGLAGEYKYPDVPHDVYRRHENCRCTVLYDPADGSKKRQNVHSREWTDVRKRDKIERNNIPHNRGSVQVDPLQYRQFETGQAVNDFFYYDDEKRGLLARKSSQYGKWKSSLTSDQKSAIDAYTTGGYADLNDFLRRRGDWQNIDANAMTEFKNDLSACISEFNVKEPIKVYRYTGKDTFGDLSLDKLVGREWRDLGFMSTSPTLEGIENAVVTGKDTVLEIFVPPGKGRGAYLNELSPWKDMEYEFLLKDGSTFTITDVDLSGEKPIVRMVMK